MTLERFRKAAKTDPVKQVTDKGERCDCHGAKAKKEDKIIYPDGVNPVTLGPHRKGQVGCCHNEFYGKECEDDFGDIPFGHDHQVDNNLIPF